MKKEKVKKERLDKLLADRGLVESRTRAQALIMEGRVRVNGEKVTKAGTPLSPDCALEVEDGQRWASRGAFKLLKAIEAFGIKAADRICADIGASTGGFTDVLLSEGAQKVYAVDVGYGQLHWRLVSDPRVTVMDRTNARSLTREMFTDPISLITCDASFISLRLLLPALDVVLADGGEMVLLIKPQFEAGRERLGHGGVVRDRAVHAAVIREMLDFTAANTSLCSAGLTWSPIRGPEGNIEFLYHLTRTAPQQEFDVEELLDAAYAELLK